MKIRCTIDFEYDVPEGEGIPASKEEMEIAIYKDFADYFPEIEEGGNNINVNVEVI